MFSRGLIGQQLLLIQNPFVKSPTRELVMHVIASFLTPAPSITINTLATSRPFRPLSIFIRGLSSFQPSPCVCPFGPQERAPNAFHFEFYYPQASSSAALIVGRPSQALVLNHPNRFIVAVVLVHSHEKALGRQLAEGAAQERHN